MIDKPEKKTLTPKKTTKEKKPKIEETEEKPTTEIIEKAEASKEPTPQKVDAHPEEPAQVPIVEEAEKPAAIIEAKAELPKPKTFDDQLLAFYNAAEPGNLSLGHIMVQLDVEDPILIKQAWDRLYDLRKVPFTKLFKPPKGHIGIE